MAHPIRFDWLRLALPALAAIGGLGLLVRRALRVRALLREEHRDAPKPRATAVPPPSAALDGASWDVVDEASWESFPASDPPAW